jgi:hypothetical protein
MPVHDWTRVDPSVFYSFHLSLIVACKRALNAALPHDYYAILELRTPPTPVQDDPEVTPDPNDTIELNRDPPNVPPTAETDHAHYRRRKNVVAVRHAASHRLAARVEFVLPSDSASPRGVRDLVGKAAGLLDAGVHYLVVDLHAPGRRHPHGIHAAIWEEFTGDESPAPDRPFVAASYEADLVVRAYVQTAAEGEALPAMSLFVERNAHVVVPLEAIYQAAFGELPRFLRQRLEGGTHE